MGLKSQRIEQINEKAKQITKAKDMIEYYAQFKLKPLQLKLLDLVIAYAECDGDKFSTVTFPTALLCTHLGMESPKANLQNYHRNAKVKGLARSMMITIEKDTAHKTNIKSQPWFDEVEIDKKQATISLTLCSKLTNFLDASKALGFKDRFHQYTYHCIKSLHSRESMTLYMLLHAVLKCENGVATFSIEQLKQKLSLMPSDAHLSKKSTKGTLQYFDPLGNQIKETHSDARNFKRLILIEAINDINQNTDIHIDCLMLPDGVPDKQKTSIKFYVRDNENYVNTASCDQQSKGKLSITDIESNSNVIQKADKDILEQLKRELYDSFNSEASEYVDIVNQIHLSGEYSIEDISYRVERILVINEFLKQFPSGSELYGILKLSNIRPGLLRHSFKKPNKLVQQETLKLQDALNLQAPTPSANEPVIAQEKISDETITSIAIDVFKRTLERYRSNAQDWQSKLFAFTEAVTTGDSFNGNLKIEASLLSNQLSNTIRCAWCIFSMEEIETKSIFSPLLNDIQTIMVMEYNLSESTAKGITSKKIKSMVDKWMTYELPSAMQHNKILK